MNIAVVSGGPSAERNISLKSAQLVMDHLDREKYTPRLICLESHGWFDQESGVRIDLNDFTLRLPGKRHSFDLVFLMIHGAPAENGQIQGYFEHLGIPHSTCQTLSAALTFDKQKCKEFLAAHDVVMAKSRVLHRIDQAAKVHDLKLPLFVKPNKNGSSYGVTKVRDYSELPNAIAKSLKFDDEVIVEEFIDGIEVGAGVVSQGADLHAFPLTEIVPDGDFFDYEAKYEGKSQEITPARLSADLTSSCQQIAKALYRLLDCRGVVRFDFILKGDQFYLLEANTIPGMSPQSIVPQQALAYGWTIAQLLDVIIKDCLRS
ncbi:MAG: D-alanine--D-alanine ligase [Saprospiraceae bacterium]|nr:D-alanine--D-alanine ligase [Saprospiraceae bacterium]